MILNKIKSILPTFSRKNWEYSLLRHNFSVLHLECFKDWLCFFQKKMWRPLMNSNTTLMTLLVCISSKAGDFECHVPTIFLKDLNYSSILNIVMFVTHYWKIIDFLLLWSCFVRTISTSAKKISICRKNAETLEIIDKNQNNFSHSLGA